MLLMLMAIILMSTLTLLLSSPAGAALLPLAEVERTYARNETAYTWAQLILKLLRFPADNLPPGTMGPLREHSTQYAHPEQLAESVHECNIVKTHAGDALIARIVVGRLVSSTLDLRDSGHVGLWDSWTTMGGWD